MPGWSIVRAASYPLGMPRSLSGGPLNSLACGCLAAIASVMLVAGCGGSTPSRRTVTVAACGDVQGPCVSPDGAWSARLRGISGKNETIVLTDLRTGAMFLPAAGTWARAAAP